MKKLFTLMAIALMGLASCTLDDDNSSNTNYVQDVFIRLDNASRPGTRAEETSKGDTDADKVKFANGYIFFITGQGSIKKCYRITDTGTTDDLVNNSISIDSFWADATSSGYLFQNVSGEVKQVYIIGNISGVSEATIRSKTMLKELKEIAVSVSTQSDVDHVTMDGLDTTLETIGADDTKKKADITLVPLSSRIEIAKFTATGSVTAFKLQGIYVSHFYNEMPLNETADAAKNELFALNGGADYTQYTTMCDVAAAPAAGLGTNTGTLATPTSSNDVWAYQFLPGSNTGRVSPRLVIKINEVAASVGSFDPTKTYYLNIRGFKATGAGNVDPMAVERGKIYKIANVSFNESDISDIPNPADISLTVTVSVKNWVVENVEPVM